MRNEIIDKFSVVADVQSLTNFQLNQIWVLERDLESNLNEYFFLKHFFDCQKKTILMKIKCLTKLDYNKKGLKRSFVSMNVYVQVYNIYLF